MRESPKYDEIIRNKIRKMLEASEFSQSFKFIEKMDTFQIFASKEELESGDYESYVTVKPDERDRWGSHEFKVVRVEFQAIGRDHSTRYPIKHEALDLVFNETKLLARVKEGLQETAKKKKHWEERFAADKETQKQRELCDAEIEAKFGEAWSDRYSIVSDLTRKGEPGAGLFSVTLKLHLYDLSLDDLGTAVAEIKKLKERFTRPADNA